MKLAISGKGGVGKTLLAALLCRAFAESGYSVIAIDADPDANLASTLGFPYPEQIIPVSAMADLIEERTGARPGQPAAYFKLNPRVDDIPEKYSVKLDGIRLMKMGGIKSGGTGCYCAENALLQALVSHLLLAANEVVILDMEAGIEHLGRGTAASIDMLIVVVEPGRHSVETAYSVRRLAEDLGLPRVAIVGNKLRSQSDEAFLRASLPDFRFVGFVPFDQAIVEADLADLPVLNASEEVVAAVKGIYQTLLTASA